MLILFNTNTNIYDLMLIFITIYQHIPIDRYLQAAALIYLKLSNITLLLHSQITTYFFISILLLRNLNGSMTTFEYTFLSVIPIVKPIVLPSKNQ